MKFKFWWMAIRPKTLTAAVAPVLVGSALALKEGYFAPLYAGLALLGALLIQIGTNLCNDYFDFKKGADTSERVGPTRVTQAGLLTPQQVKISFVAVFGLAATVGIALATRGGWPILLIGIASIISGIAYTAGPWPLAYLGLGEIFVLVFFGPVAVAGTYYVQALQWSSRACLAGLALGFLSTAILVVNNLRDIEQDRQANKKTLAVRFGKNFAHAEYVFCLLASALIACWLLAFNTAMLTITALVLLRRSTLQQLLPRTALLLLIYALGVSAELV